MKNRARGFVLPIVIAIILVIALLLPALVTWLQQDTKQSAKVSKMTLAFNLAEAGIDRGMWKLKSSTSTFEAAYSSTVIAGYNFDTTYNDVPGGTYRIKFQVGGYRQVVITAEGRDSAARETRAIQEIVENRTIYSALMAGGNINWSKGLGLYWGPIMAQGNLTLMDDYVAALYFPRKYAKGVVQGTATYPRDTNGLSLPNTDNVEWWSSYDGVPPLPILDFAALRSSAAATGTLNVYGCRSTQGGAGTLGSATKWDTRASCPSGAVHTTHFGNPWSHPKSARLNPNTDYVWYWDGDVVLSGQFCGSSPCNQSTGLRGIVIVRGNLTIDTPGEFSYTGHVPSDAYLQEEKLTKTTWDSSATREYPADTGLHSNSSTFNFGSDTWCQPNGGGCGWVTTVGIKGFTYVGGDLVINQFMDFNGAVWVNGNATASGGTNTSFCGVFYDDTLMVPALNVILIRDSWKEVKPSATAWN